MNTLWHSIILVSIFYVSWSAFGQTRPLLADHKEAKLHYVNAGVCCCLSQLFFLFILYTVGAPLGAILPFVCFVTWTATLFVILRNSRLAAFTRRTSLAFVIAAPLILLLYPGGTGAFLLDLDRFSVDVLNRATSPKANVEADSKGSSKPQADSKNEAASAEDSSKKDQSGSENDSKKAAASGESSDNSRPEFKVSHLIKATFFFIQAFLLTNYYGKMWHYRRVEKQRRESNVSFERESVEQAILILSIALSVWVAFVLLGFDTLSVSVFSGFVALSASIALRDLLTNFLAGVLLLWGKSVKQGDVIAIDKTRVGEVTSIGLRHMEIEDRNDISYLVPHSQLLNTVH